MVKPAHFTVGVIIELAKIFAEAGLPPGVFNVVTSAFDNGSLVGSYLCASKDIDMISFTGSSATASKVMATAADTIKKVSFELGGKSPNVIFDDVYSIDAAAAGAVRGIVGTAGQACQSGSRVLVQESIHDEFVSAVVKRMQTSVRMGDPLAPETTMGPLASDVQYDRVAGFIASGRESATLVTGGGQPSDPALEKGFFIEPTVFVDVDNASRHRPRGDLRAGAVCYQVQEFR